MHKILSTIFLFLACCAATLTAQAETKTAIFAGGCFWCMQPPFDAAKGVTQTIVGYTGGSKETASYELVSAHKTQHREVIEVTYDPGKISYDQLLDIFWHNVKPTQADGQFHDIGLSYQAAIYFADDAEKKQAETSKERLDKSGKFKQPVVTEILPRMPFYPAEDYHQKYYLKNPQDFESYHIGSGRVDYLEGIWGKPDR